MDEQITYHGFWPAPMRALAQVSEWMDWMRPLLYCRLAWATLHIGCAARLVETVTNRLAAADTWQVSSKRFCKINARFYVVLILSNAIRLSPAMADPVGPQRDKWFAVRGRLA